MADLLADNRALLHDTLNYLDPIQQAIVDQRDQYDDLLHRTPTALNTVGRAVGSYGDWVNFYLCDLTLKTRRAAARRPGPHGQDLAAADG